MQSQSSLHVSSSLSSSVSSTPLSTPNNNVTTYDALIQYLHHVYAVQFTDTPQYQELAAQIEQIAPKIYKKHGQHLDNILLDPTQLQLPTHTLPYILLLSCKKYMDISNHAQYQGIVANIVMQSDPTQLQYCVKDYITILQHYGLSMQQNQSYAQCLQPFYHAIQTLNQILPHTITAVHKYLLIAIQKLHLYSNIEQILDAMYYTVIPKQVITTDIEPILLYYYYAGAINATMKRYKQAIQCYTTVLSLPTFNVVSAIQIAAYKRYIIVSLLQYSTVPPLHSRTTSMIVARNIDALGTIELYNAIKDVYCNGSLSDLNKTLQDKAGEIQSDNLFGLCNRLHTAYIVHAINKLSHIYKSLTISQLTNKLNFMHSVAECESTISTLIQQQLIAATLHPTTHVVEFIDVTDHTYDNAADGILIQQQFNQIKILNDRLRTVDLEYGVHSLYLTKTEPALNIDTSTKRSGYSKRGAAQVDRHLHDMLESNSHLK